MIAQHYAIFATLLAACLAAYCLWLAYLAAISWQPERRRRRGQCPTCGYDRKGLLPNAPCPECGDTPFPAVKSDKPPAG